MKEKEIKVFITSEPAAYTISRTQEVESKVKEENDVQNERRGSSVLAISLGGDETLDNENLLFNRSTSNVVIL